MKKYVSKEDVEKGLVDPKRSLEEQPEYKKKIEQEHQEKQKFQDNRPQRQRPKKQRPPRKERPKFNWNKNDITLDSKAPEKPKKLIEKPDAQKHKDGFQKLKAQREVLKEQRHKLIDEQRMILRDINQSKKNGREVNTQYSGALKEKMNYQNQIRKQIRTIDDEKKKIYEQMNFLQRKIEDLRRPSDSQGFSIEDIHRKVAEKEHELTTANIGKREQTKLTNEINELKRALNSARPSIEIDSQINKLNDQIAILKEELKPIKNQLHVKITHANQIKEQITILKQQYTNEKGNVKEHKTVEQIKAEYDVKLKAVEDKRDKLEERIDDYMDKHTRAIDDYEDQQDLLRYIQWVGNQVERLKKRKEEEAEREKRRLQAEKKRQKEKEAYQKRQEDKRKNEEIRKQKQEDRKQKLQKEKQDFINRNPNHETIDLCDSLIDYCQSLRPVAVYHHEDTRKNPGQLNFGKDWQKEMKNGAQVLVSKKSKQDQEVKKPKKERNRPQKVEDQNFEHGIQVINQFQLIKLLPPNNAGQIDSTIKLIKDKIEFYNNPSEEQIAKFKEKSIKEWQEKHAPRERNQQGHYKEKKEEEGEEVPAPKKEKKEYAKKEKKTDIDEGDFPQLA